MDCVTTRLQMEIGMFFSVFDPETARKLAKFFLVVRERRKKLVKMTNFQKEGRQKFFPRKCRNRDKICQVVRESEKVENRWT